MPKNSSKAKLEAWFDSDSSDLPPELAERLERAENLLIEAFELLKHCMPSSLACTIATQVIEDLASLETSQPPSRQLS